MDRYLLNVAGFSSPGVQADLSPKEWARVPVAAVAERLVPQVGQIIHKDSAATQEARLQIKEFYAQSSMMAMLVQHQLLRVTKAFKDAGIDSCPLKGIALAERLFGDPTMRQCGDIDLLVQPRERDQAMAILAELGFQPEGPYDDSFDHHVVTQGTFGGTRLSLELHTGIRVNNRPWFPETWWKDRVPLKLQGTELSVFRDDHLLVYLCHHAATHGFSAWGWLLDIATLLRVGNVSPSAIETAVRSSGLNRPVYYALSLVRHLGGTHIDPELIVSLQPDRNLWWLVRTLLFYGPRSNPELSRLVAAVTSSHPTHGNTRDWVLPSLRLFRKKHPRLSPVTARCLYIPWMAWSLFRAGVAVIRTGFSLGRS